MIALPKDQSMQIIEWIYNVLQPEYLTFDTYNLDILKLEKLESIVENTENSDEFFDAYNEIKKIKESVEKQNNYPSTRIVIQRLNSVIRSASNRICEICEGRGVLNANLHNPNQTDCKCNGGLL